MAKNLEATPGAEAELPQTPRAILIALSGILLGIGLSSLEQTVVGTAMPRVIAELQGFDHYSWVATAYLLTSTAVIPIAGKLGDLFGRKWLYMGAIVIFLFGSLLCGIAQSMLWLVLARAFQGIGAGAMQANAFAIIGEMFSSGAQRARWQGLFAGVWVISSVIGPTLGGWITDGPGWRWVFYINLPFGALALAVIWRNLPNLHSKNPNRSIDYLGSATITAAVVSLLLALSWAGGESGWALPQVWAGLGLAVVLTVVFIFIEQRAKEPVIPLDLFRLRAVTASTLMSFTVGGVMLGTLIYAPLFVQGVLGESASSSGTIMTPLLLSVALGNILTGQVIGRFGRMKFLAVSGSLWLIIGIILLLFMDAQTSGWVVTLFLLVIGLGLGQVMPTTNISVQEVTPRPRLGAGIAAVQFARSIGSTLGVSIVGAIVTPTFYENLQKVAPPNIPPALLAQLHDPQALVSPDARARLSAAAAQIENGPNALAALYNSAREALATSLHNGFFVILAIAVLAFGAAMLLPDLKLRLNPKKHSKSEPIANLDSVPAAPSDLG